MKRVASAKWLISTLMVSQPNRSLDTRRLANYLQKQSKPPVKRVVCSRPIRPWYRQRLKALSFHFVQAAIVIATFAAPKRALALLGSPWRGLGILLHLICLTLYHVSLVPVYISWPQLHSNQPCSHNTLLPSSILWGWIRYDICTSTWYVTNYWSYSPLKSPFFW